MLPISRRTLSQFISIIACFIFVIWGFSQYGKSGDIPYEQAAGLLLALAAFLGSSRISENPVFQLSEKEMAARDAFNRQAMLNRVRDFWVKGVLESSLHEEARIDLGLEERRDAVAERPWDVILRTPDRPDCKLPPGTKISDVFERVGRSLLILGEPGAGKTTTLLELAREMIEHAGEDPSEKIPVVFNLSSWTDPKQPIADWLTEELREKYNIPKKIAAPWVENDSLLLLLDGLDEVAPERREACIEAINGFLEEHFVPLVVCCRKEEYDALDGRLNLQSAVLLQPLTPEQIDGYLERLCPDLNALREALRSDRELHEFAQTPLILSIMTLAYRGMPVEEIQLPSLIKERREHLFKTYVEKMFKRDTPRTDSELYPKGDTIRWLSWLARKMSEHGRTVFLIERMQPRWLETKAQKQLNSILCRLVFGLVFGLLVGLVVGLVGLVFGWSFCLVYALLFGLLVGLVVVLVDGLADEIVPAEILKWSEENASRGMEDSLLEGLVFGLVFGLVVGVLEGLAVGLVLGWGFCVVYLLVFGLMKGLSTANIEEISTPNQGIKQSAKNAFIVWLVFGLVGGVLGGELGAVLGALAIGPVVGMLDGLGVGLAIGLTFGLVVGVQGGMSFGGLAVVQHFALRFALHREGLLPWRLVTFLDYATERIFLRKVGGGYVFVHRMLMDYFALWSRDLKSGDI